MKMNKIQYSELVKDAVWEIKRGNHKISTIENGDYVVLLSAFNENIILRYYLYKIKKENWRDVDEEKTSISLQKQITTREPIIINDGRITINGIPFVMEKREEFDRELYTSEEARKDIEYLQEHIETYADKAKSDAENIIANLDVYIEYCEQEQISMKNMKFYNKE